MDLSRELEVLINTCALPLTAVDNEPKVIPRGRATMTKKCLVDCHSSSIAGSISEVNQRLSERRLALNALDVRLAIETFESEKASGVRSQDSAQDRGSAHKQGMPLYKSVDAKSARTLTKRKIADKNLLAELFQHPEFNESQPNELPNGVVFHDMVRNLIMAERRPLTGKTFCVEREMEKFFLSPSVKAIWLDSFWWVFHERYKPDKEIQSKLFNRIALNYASMLFHGPGSFYERAILKRLPMLLSQALYTSFCCCFSQSWLNTHEFKSTICDTMGLWFSGIYPTPQSYDSWNYSKLDPERHRREELMNLSKYPTKGKDRGSIFSPRRPTVLRINKLRKPTMQGATSEKPVSSGPRSEDSSRTQDTYTPKEPLRQTLVLRKATQQVKNISEARWQAEILSKESHPVGTSPQMKKYLFNVCAKSPLILHFLNSYTCLSQHGEDVLIARWERGRMLPETSLTYRDIIRLAMSSMARRKTRIVQLHQQQQQSWQKFNRHLRELWSNFQREVKNLERKEAEMKKESHRFILSQSSAKLASRQDWGSHLREIDFILRRHHSRNPQKGGTCSSKRSVGPYLSGRFFS